MAGAPSLAYTVGIQGETAVAAAYAPMAWLDRMRLLRSGGARRANPGSVSAGILHLSLSGEPDACTRTSGALPGAVQGDASVSLGQVIEASDAFERTVRALVPVGSQRRVMRECSIDFASHRVVVLGVRVPPLSWVRLAGVREFDDRIEVAASADGTGSRGGAAALGLIWLALPRGSKPVTVRSLVRSA